MNINDIQPLENIFSVKIGHTNCNFVRYLYNEIDWSLRLIGIKGARGVGKTTMLLQRIKLAFKNRKNVFYVSLDNLWFKTNSLVDLVQCLYSNGIRNIFLDEVHKYPDWTLNIKNLYDNYPDLNIVYTGSSMIEIENSKVDLSRRQTIYTLYGMSFREFLDYEDIYKSKSISFTELLDNHQEIATDIISKIPILKYFNQYLQYGYYPFYKEAGKSYYSRLNEIVNLILETDMPSIENVSYSTIEKTKKLLMIISDNVPFVPNLVSLCDNLSCTRESCLKMLYTLDKAAVLNIISSELKNYKKLKKPEKIYLSNVNLMYALGSKTDIGNIRECFFASQLNVKSTIQIPNTGDFLIDGKYLFEVGGMKKNYSQIADIPNSYLAIDDIDTGIMNKIPLWMFGWLY